MHFVRNAQLGPVAVADLGTKPVVGGPGESGVIRMLPRMLREGKRNQTHPVLDPVGGPRPFRDDVLRGSELVVDRAAQAIVGDGLRPVHHRVPGCGGGAAGLDSARRGILQAEQEVGRNAVLEHEVPLLIEGLDLLGGQVVRSELAGACGDYAFTIVTWYSAFLSNFAASFRNTQLMFGDRASFGFSCWSASAGRMSAAHQHNDIEVNFSASDLVYMVGGRRVEVTAGRVSAFWGATPHQLVEVRAEEPITWLTIPLARFTSWRVPRAAVRALLGGEVLVAPADWTVADGGRRLAPWTHDLGSGSEFAESVAALEVEASLSRFALVARPQAGARWCLVSRYRGRRRRAAGGRHGGL